MVLGCLLIHKTANQISKREWLVPQGIASGRLWTFKRWDLMGGFPVIGSLAMNGTVRAQPLSFLLTLGHEGSLSASS